MASKNKSPKQTTLNEQIEMARPTLAEQQAEIEALTELMPKVCQRTAFGDNNIAAIEAQIEVIEKRMSYDQIADREDDETWNEFVASSARDARAWLDGDSEDGPQSQGWKELT
jgi:transcription elongation GreA/GreB family factor